MQSGGPAVSEINALEAQAARAAQSGRDAEAFSLWTRILQIDPNHSRTLNALGMRAMRTGDFRGARAAFKRLTDSNGTEPQQWMNLALACRQLKDEAGEESAIQRALSLDPTELVALLLRADLLERQGKTHQAAMAYGAAATVAPPIDRLHPDLKPAVSHAFAYRQQYDRDFAAFMDRYLEPYEQDTGERVKRFRDSLDILVGRKRRFDSQSVVYHYPGLAPIEFFERSEFPWLEEIEATAEAIRT